MNYWLLGALFFLWIGAVAFLRYFRIWLPYYLFGAVGLVYWLALVAGNILHLEPYLAHTVAWAVHLISGAFAIPTRIFENAPGILLVLVVVQQVGWTVLQIGVESSGLLEISVLISILAFYPGWSLMRRGLSILAGGVALWLANVLRMMIIVVMLNQMGKGALVLAHTFVGRIVFFLLTILIFWYLVTSATLATIRAKQDQARLAG